MLIWKYRSGIFEMPFSEIVSQFINCKIETTYWFFIPLFAVYLSIPILSLLANIKFRKVLCYMTGLTILTYSILPLAFNLLKIPFNNALSLPIAGGYVVFVLLGYLLSTTDIKKPVRYGIYVFGILCACLRYFSTLIISQQQHELFKVFWGYTNLPSVGLAVAVFVFFKSQSWKWIAQSESLTKIVKTVSSASFGIYLIHMIIIREVCNIFHVNIYSGWWRAFAAVGVYLTALFIIKILQRLPLIKHLVP